MKRLNIEFIRSEFAKEGYILLTKTYENAHQKLEYICPRGHQRFIIWNSWQRNQRCPCFSNKMKPTIEHIRAKFAEEDYVLSTETYDNNSQKLDYICPMGHHHSITWGNWISKKRCPERSNRISKWEREVKSFISKSNINYVSNDRTQLINPNTNHSLELDLWFPQLNKAIECNGLYWHEKRKQNDRIKQQLCKKQRIDLLILTDKEWTSAQEKCQTDILSFLESK